MSTDPADLANLAELALPPPVPFWPPAAGLWILAVGAVAAVSVFTWRAFRRYRADAYLRQALGELDALATTGQASESEPEDAVSAIIKRVAIIGYGRERVAALTGQDWVHFIGESAPRDAPTDAIASALTNAAAAAHVGAAERRLLFAQAKAWLLGQRGRVAAVS